MSECSVDIRFLTINIRWLEPKKMPEWQTCGRFQNANFSFSNALIYYVHQLGLDIIRLIWMVKVFNIRLHLSCRKRVASEEL